MAPHQRGCWSDIYTCPRCLIHFLNMYSEKIHFNQELRKYKNEVVMYEEIKERESERKRKKEKKEEASCRKSYIH